MDSGMSRAPSRQARLSDISSQSSEGNPSSSTPTVAFGPVTQARQNQSSHRCDLGSDADKSRLEDSPDDPEFVSQALDAPTNYKFHRLTRSSVMLGMGLPPGNSRHRTQLITPDWVAPSLVDSYWMMSMNGGLMMYMAVVCGRSMFDLPTCLSKCGLVPGICVILTFAWSHHFASQCVIGFPRTVQRNMETFSDLFGACFIRNKLAKTVVGVTCAICWGSYCTFSYWNFVMDVVTIVEGDSARRESTVSSNKGLIVFLGVLLSYQVLFNYSASSLKWTAKYSLIALGVALVLEAGFALQRGLRLMGTGTIVYDMYPSDGFVFFQGVCPVVNAFSGVAFLPYVVAGMLRPEEAKPMLTRCCQYISILYTMFAVITFFGFGRDSISETLGTSKSTGPILGRLMSFFLMIRDFLAYKLHFMPVLREIEPYIDFEGAPEVELGLPWAIKALRWKKHTLRVIGVALTSFPLFFSFEFLSAFTDVIMCVFDSLIQHLLPAALVYTGSFLLRVQAASGSDNPSRRQSSGSPSVPLAWKDYWAITLENVWAILSSHDNGTQLPNLRFWIAKMYLLIYTFVATAVVVFAISRVLG